MGEFVTKTGLAAKSGLEDDWGLSLLDVVPKLARKPPWRREDRPGVTMSLTTTMACLSCDDRRCDDGRGRRRRRRLFPLERVWESVVVVLLSEVEDLAFGGTATVVLVLVSRRLVETGLLLGVALESTTTFCPAGTNSTDPIGARMLA